MSGPDGDAQGSPSPAGSVVGALGGVMREFNQTAESILRRLRDYPLELTNGGVVTKLGGEDQLRELRAAMPRRVLSVTEGLQIADRQASLLRWQLDASASPALPTEALTGLPFLSVTYRASLGKSGLATNTQRGWVIVLKADEPQVRQRFSLAHEIKHALDDELLGRLPDGLYRSWDDRSADELAERVCDQFAGCLLVPKLLLRRDWTSGMQEVSVLARRYNVSRAAMDVRLHQIGLIEPAQRCGTRRSGRLDFNALQSNDRDERVAPEKEPA